MDLWDDELNHYNSLFKKFQKWHPDRTNVKKQFLEAPISYVPTEKTVLAYNIYSLALSTGMNSILESIACLSMLWEKRLFTQISLPVRFTFEIWAAVHYGMDLIYKINDTQDIKEIERLGGLIRRLTWGSRYPIVDPRGQPLFEESLNVLTLIDRLNKDYPNARDSYEFLCVSCHPTHFPLTYWSFISGGFHKNEPLKKHGHESIQKTLNAMDSALIGSSEDISKAVKMCIEIVENEKRY